MSDGYLYRDENIELARAKSISRTAATTTEAGRSGFAGGGAAEMRGSLTPQADALMAALRLLASAGPAFNVVTQGWASARRPVQ